MKQLKIEVLVCCEGTADKRRYYVGIHIPELHTMLVEPARYVQEWAAIRKADKIQEVLQ